MDDAAGFFANVFGGERFKEWVRVFLYNHLHRSDYWVDWRNITHERDDFCRKHNDV